MTVKLSAFISYCSLNVTASEIIPGPFLPLDNSSFFRDTEQFGLKRAIWSQGQRLNLQNSLSRLQPFASPKALQRAIFCIWSILVSESLFLCLPKQPMSLPRWHPLRQNTQSSGGRQTEHLQPDLYHSPPLEFAQDSCSSDVCQHKGHSLQPLSNISIVKALSCLKDWNRGTNSEKKPQIKQASGKEKIGEDEGF